MNREIQRDDRSLRIALVAPFGLRPKGTTSARLLPIGRILALSGATVGAFIPPWDDPARSNRSWVEAGVQVAHTPAGEGPGSKWRTLLALARMVRQFQPDVVHVFKPIGYSGAVAWVFDREGRRSRRVARGQSPTPRPIVVVDTDDLEGPGGWAGRPDASGGPLGLLRGLQERITLGHAGWATVASRWLYGYTRSLNVPDDHILYLPNGHDVGDRQARLAQADRRHSAPSVLWYTRFTEASPQRVAEMLGPVLREHGVRLAIIGEELRPGAQQALETALIWAGVDAHTEWLGYRPELLEDYVRSHADGVVAVYPLDDDVVNRARSPSKLPQLMALGVPVVAEAVGEASAYLAGFETECLAAVGDVEGFQSRLGDLLSSEPARGSLSARLMDAAQAWRWESTAGGLLEFYRRAGAQSRSN